jgi:hypothetical protein
MLIDTAVKHNIDIKFEDKAMEIKRQSWCQLMTWLNLKNHQFRIRKKRAKADERYRKTKCTAA